MVTYTAKQAIARSNKRVAARQKAKAIKRSSKRVTAGQLGLTGEDIRKLQLSLKKQNKRITSSNIERTARTKVFRETFIRGSGTPESVLKPSTIRQLKTGQLTTKGGFSIIEGVLVPTRVADKVARALAFKRQLKANEKRLKADFAKWWFTKNQEVLKKKAGNNKLVIPVINKFTGRIENKVIPTNITVNKFSGEIRATEKPKKILDRLSFELSGAKSTQLTALDRPSNMSAAERQFRGIVILGALGVGRGLVGTATIIRHPIKSIKGIFAAAKTPEKTARAMLHEFKIDPVGTILEFLTFNKALKVIGTSGKRSTVGRYVNEEFFIRTQPIEIQSAVRAIIKGSKAQEVLNPFQLKQLKKIDFIKVKTLTKIEAAAVKQAIKKTDSVIFGSLASRTLAKGATKIAKDIDLATKNITKFNEEFIKALPRNARQNYIIKAQKILRKSDKQALLDVKPIERLIPGRSIFSRRGFLPVSGYVRVVKAPKGSILPKLSKRPGIARLTIPTQKLVKVDKIKLIGFGEQTTRKGLGTLQVLIEKNSRRAKDPQAFVESLQLQLEQLKKVKPKTPLGKVLKNSRIKTLKDSLKILTSKSFIKLLEKKVPGINKEFPLLNKINISKLKKVRKLPIKKIKLKLKKIRKLKPSKRIKRITRKRVTKRLSKKKTSRLPSKLKAGKKKQSSLIPSRLKKPSRIPKSRLSRIPKSITPSFLSRLTPTQKSKLKNTIISKIPRSVISKIPKSRLSKIPISKLSKLQSGLSRLSKIPNSRLSVLTFKKLKKVMTKKQIEKIKKPKEKEKIKKKIKAAVLDKTFIFLPDLFSKITKTKATSKQKKILLKKGRIFTGFEVRGLV